MILLTGDAGGSVVVTIGSHSFTDPVVSVRPQQRLEHVIEWRPDGALDVERFAGIVSKRTQRG